MSLLKTLDKQQEKRGKNGLSVIADMGVYFHFQYNKDVLIDFESSLPKFDMNVKRICIYHAGDFERFEQYEKDNLIKSHHRRIKVCLKLLVEISLLPQFYLDINVSLDNYDCNST